MFWGQPVVDAATGAIDHHELLLRMDLDGDVITPNHFLPHAEDSELITEIDRFAIETGFEIAATTAVAINLSAKSLQDPRLIDDIKEALGTRALARQRDLRDHRDRRRREPRRRSRARGGAHRPRVRSRPGRLRDRATDRSPTSSSFRSPS